MAFTALTSAQCDADSPLDETLTQLIRTNFDDHEARINSTQLATENQIVDHFFISGLNTATWLSAGQPNTFSMPSDGTHKIRIQSGVAAGEFGILTSAVGKARFRLNQNQALYMEWRAFADQPSNAPDNLMMGFQDGALTDVIGTIADQTDMIGFVMGTTAGQWKFRTAKAASASEDDDVASRAAWHI